MSEGIKAMNALRIPSDPHLAEKFAHEQIEILRQEFQMKAEPFVQLLLRINEMKPLTMVIASTQASKLWSGDDGNRS